MTLSTQFLSFSRSHGVTLIEMMIGLIIITIGLGIAVPSFQGMIARNQIATDVNDMLLAINLARSEAARRGAIVSIQAISSTTADEFGGGWCVVPGNPQNCNADVIRTFAALVGSATLNLVDDGGDDFVLFTSLGGVSGDLVVNIDLCIAGQIGRRIVISPIGRSSSHRPDDAIADRQPDC